MFSRHSCSLCGLNCEQVEGGQTFLVIVDVVSLILFQLFDSFSISECLRRARGRKYSRGLNKLQDNFCLFLVVEDREPKHHETILKYETSMCALLTSYERGFRQENLHMYMCKDPIRSYAS